MANIRTFFANAYETTLTSEMGPTALTTDVATMDGAPQTPCRLVIDPDDPLKREYLLYSSTAGSTFVLDSITDRYGSGSADTSGITHDVGAVIKMAPLHQHFDDLHDRIEARLATNAHTKATHDALGLAHSSLTGLTDGDPHSQYLNITRHDVTARHGSNVVDHGAIGGLSDDDHPQYALVTGTRAFTGAIQATNFRGTVTSLATSGTATIDLSAAAYRTHTLTGSVTYATSNIADGRSVTVKVSAGTATRSVSFPSGWKFVGEKPTEIEANATAILTITAFGLNDNDIVAAWAVSE